MIIIMGNLRILAVCKCTTIKIKEKLKMHALYIWNNNMDTK